MKKAWENDSCNEVRGFFTFYTIPQAAMLWCGVPPDEVEDELELASSIGASAMLRAVLRHPYIPCLEPRCRVLHDAIDGAQLAAGRDGGRALSLTEGGHVAYDRRTVFRDALKAWIGVNFPNDKPAFLFDDIERSTHTAINADSFRALQADRDALKARIEKATEAYRTLKQELNDITGERDSLRTMVEKNGKPGERAETTYENIIGGLLGLMLGKTPAGKPQSAFENQASIISAMLGNFPGKPGISARTLEEKFASAKRSLSAT